MNLFINCCPRVDSRTKILADTVLAEIGEYEEVNLYSIEFHSLDVYGYNADTIISDKVKAIKEFL